VRGRAYVLPRPPNDLLEFLPLATTVLVKLLKILDTLLRFGNDGLLEVGGFAKQLFSGDLREVQVSAVLTR
jgi:hypothetical protein